MSLKDVHDELVSNEGVMAVTMAFLRDAYPAGKLGIHVVANISRELDGYGVGHFPDPLTTVQDDWVLLYKKNTPVAEVVASVTRPSEAGAERLRAVARNEDSDIVKRIREMVCD